VLPLNVGFLEIASNVELKTTAVYIATDLESPQRHGGWPPGWRPFFPSGTIPVRVGNWRKRMGIEPIPTPDGGVENRLVPAPSVLYLLGFLRLSLI